MKSSKITDLDYKLLKELYPNNLEEVLEKIEQDYPVQYLIGNVDFYDSTILVNENVLIPRFETEYLVEKTIKKLRKYPDNSLKIIDIGCGSGCIIINIAKNLKQHYTALDISENALTVAKQNAKLNEVNINFIKKDILSESLSENYDVIISNPPYVTIKEEVGASTKFEPQIALFALDNGILFYKRILGLIQNEPKLIAFEIGATQGEEICHLAQSKFPSYNISLEKDLNGRDRYIFIEKPETNL